MNVTKDIRYIGVNDHEIDLFEGMYIVPEGMAYNSYVILDEKVAVMDTADRHFVQKWLGNLEAALEQFLTSIDEGRRNFIVSSVGVTEKGYEAVLAFETVRHDGRNVEVVYDGSYHFRLI